MKLYIGEYLLNNRGGAEKSSWKFIHDNNINFVLTRPGNTLKPSSGIVVLDGLKSRRFPLFPFWHYLIVKREVRLFLRRNRCFTEIYSHGLISSAIPLDKKSNIFIRCETEYGVFKNYHTKNSSIIMKNIKDIIELLPRLIYKADLQRSVRSADTVYVNSKFVQERVKQLFGREGTVVYPDIVIPESFERQKILKYDVLFVGDNVYKGSEIFDKIVEANPDIKFAQVSRSISDSRQNVTKLPWVEDVFDYLKCTRLVIVPSQWEEAYGRIAREAYTLKMPVLVSKTGGLPEAVDFNKDCLVDDYMNYKAWSDAIRRKVMVKG